MDKKLEKNYDEIVKKLYTKDDDNYHVLKTVEGKKFKLIKSIYSNMVVVPFTDKATNMTISKDEIDLFLENGKGNYISYTKIIMDYLNGNKNFEDVAIEENNVINQDADTKIENNMNIKNIILYGPPGVGKTHNYQKLISMIEDGKTQKDIFDAISKNDKTKHGNNDIYNAINDDGRVEFVTFHQSYSYEDFIEGFRPSEDGDIKLEDGIFKIISDKAIENIQKNISTEKLIFKDAFNILFEPIMDDELVRINLKKDNSFFEIYDFNKQTLYYTRQGRSKDEKYHTLALSTLEQMYNDEENNIVTGGLRSYYEPLLHELLKIGKENKIEKVEQKNHYIVIDEINRGNISKIFGELITLIEEDKRDSYSVTLPYSKQSFKVPSNLYIIATMNSTDKSIATIDIALRRRFTFLKMQPNPLLVTNEQARNFMNDINGFIIDKNRGNLGEDYQIGHSYFMTVKDADDLEFVKKYKILPLLEEYFYADEKNFKIAKEILNIRND
jgi:5-methylcytosine-specific restriction protein B